MSEPRKRYRALPGSITSKKLALITKLASEGMNRVTIGRTLKLEVNAFNRYRETGEAFLSGVDILATNTARTIIKACDTSFMDRKLLAERLSLFSEPFTLKKGITSNATAKSALAQSIAMFTEGKITDGQLQAITRACVAWVELEGQTKLMSDVSELKKIIANKGKQ